MKFLRQTQHTQTRKHTSRFSSSRMRRRVTGKVCTDIWEDRSGSIVTTKQSTKIHIRPLYSVDSLRQNSYVPPADLCFGYPLHKEVGEVAAVVRRSAKRNGTCSIQFAVGATVAGAEFTLGHDRVCVCVCARLRV
jgi:hypothetical protein